MKDDSAAYRVAATTIGSIVLGAAIGSAFSPGLTLGIAAVTGVVGLAISIPECSNANPPH